MGACLTHSNTQSFVYLCLFKLALLSTRAVHHPIRKKKRCQLTKATAGSSIIVDELMLFLLTLEVARTERATDHEQAASRDEGNFRLAGLSNASSARYNDSSWIDSTLSPAVSSS